MSESNMGESDAAPMPGSAQDAKGDTAIVETASQVARQTRRQAAGQCLGGSAMSAPEQQADERLPEHWLPRGGEWFADGVKEYAEEYAREALKLARAALPAVDRDAVLEEAAKVCDGIADASWHAYKDRYSQHRADPHYQGKSDGAEDCAIAIRALKGQTR